MDLNNVQRIKIVLSKLLEPNFEPKNETHLDELLEYLTEKAEFVSGYCPEARHYQLLTVFLKAAILKWKLNGVTPNPQVLKFIMNLIIWMCGKIETFEMLTKDNLLFHLILFLSKLVELSVAEIGEKFIKLLALLTDHEPGLQIILYSKHWKTIMKFGISYRNQNISVSTGKCIAKIIKKSELIDQFSCKMIIETMLSPLILASKRRALFLEPMETIDSPETISPALHILINVLDNLLEYQINMNNIKITRLFPDQNAMVKCVHIMRTNNNDDFLHDLYKILVILCFSEIHIKLNDRNEKCQIIKNLTKKILELLYDVISNVKLENTLKLINTCIGYWDILERKIEEIIKSPINLPLMNQLLFLLVYNATVYRFSTFRLAFRNLEENGDSQYSTILKSMLPEVWRIHFKWRENSDQNLSLSQGVLTLQLLIQSLHQYNTSQAIAIFQNLIYNFKDISRILQMGTDLDMLLLSQPEYMTLLFQCITEFIEYLPYSWNHSVEALDILEYIYDFLVHLEWPPNIVVSGLQLADKAIWKCMSPQMILLMDKEENYSLKPFAPMLRANLKNPHWNIRQCSVDLIGTICANAITKYRSFRKLLLNNGFPCLVLDVAINDSNSFVRKAALKCLQQTIQIEECWHLLFMNNIIETTLNIFKSELEGNVRVEAVLLLKSIYQHQQLSKDVRGIMYKAMTRVAKEDSEITVRIQSLHFWRSVIDRQLLETGMVDGEFPETLFGKRFRKIINLNETIIKKILIRALHQLAVQDCLLVFYVALHNDVNSEMYKCARILISDFVTLLRHYKITSSDFISTWSTPITTSTDFYMNDIQFRTVTPSTSGSFFNCFLGGFDNIIGELNENNVTDERTINSTEIIEPLQFMKYIDAEFHNQSEESKKGDHFKVLLDEILGENIQ